MFRGRGKFIAAAAASGGEGKKRVCFLFLDLRAYPLRLCVVKRGSMGDGGGLPLQVRVFECSGMFWHVLACFGYLSVLPTLR